MSRSRVRISLSLKLGLAGVALGVIVVTVALSTLLLVGKRQREQRMIARDRALAAMLAGLRDQSGQLDFPTLRAFVDASDKLHSGIVYALEVDAGGRLIRGAVNTRVFAEIHSTLARHARAGAEQLVASLAQRRIKRQGHIKEFELGAPSGRLRLGFDLSRLRDRRRQRVVVGLLLLGAALLLGGGGGAVVGLRLGRRVRRLSGALRGAAGGERFSVPDRSGDEIGELTRVLGPVLEGERGTRAPLDELYLSPPVVQRLRRNDDPLTLPVEERAVCLLSFSLCGFEEQQRASSSPRAAMSLLNDYLAPVIEAIVAEQGVVVAISGPRVQAIWGAPDDVDEAELRAVRACVRARDSVRSLTRRHQLADKPTLGACGAITSGRAAVGNIGSAHRLAYAPVGEVVQNGSRSLNAASEGMVLVDAVAFERLADRVEAVAHDEIARSGEAPLQLYRVERLV